MTAGGPTIAATPRSRRISIFTPCDDSMWRIVSPPLPMTRPSLPLTSISMVALPVSGSMVNSGVREPGASAGGSGAAGEGSDASGAAAAAGARFLEDLAGEAGSSPERLRFFSSPRDASGSLFAGGVSSSGGVSVAAFAPASPGGGAGEGVGVSRPDPRFRTLTSSGARRVARGRGARRRASRAKTDGIGRGRPRRTGDPGSPRDGLASRTWSVLALGLGARAVVGQRRLQPRHERRLQAGRVEAPGLQLFTQLRHGHLRDRHLRHRSVGWRSKFSTRARVCPEEPPIRPKLQPPSRFPLEERGKCLSSQIIMCDIPFGVRFLSEGGEFNNSHRKGYD